jgi:uncharacterized membrane protein
MEEWLHLVTKDTVIVIDAMRLIVCYRIRRGISHRALGGIFPRQRRTAGSTKSWRSYGRWLVASLTFQPTANIIRTSIEPTWQDVG